MKFTKLCNLVLILKLLLVVGCGNNDNGPTYPTGLPNGPTLPPLTGPNVLTMTVNGSTCAANSYFNKPCVSIQVCTPGTSTCQTINDVLVDSGSVGLRIFKSILTV